MFPMARNFVMINPWLDLPHCPFCHRLLWPYDLERICVGWVVSTGAGLQISINWSPLLTCRRCPSWSHSNTTRVQPQNWEREALWLRFTTPIYSMYIFQKFTSNIFDQWAVAKDIFPSEGSRHRNVPYFGRVYGTLQGTNYWTSKYLCHSDQSVVQLSNGSGFSKKLPAQNQKMVTLESTCKSLSSADRVLIL